MHGLELLDYPLSQELKQQVISTLASCQSPTGGFSGGHGQMAHLATTYAAVHALAIVGTHEAFELIQVSLLADFLKRMKQPDGSFRMHDGGEVDVR